MIAAIALADWRVEGNIPLGFLYLFPMLLAGSVLRRWQIAAVAVLCTFLTEVFDSFAWVFEAGVPRDILIFAAFFCTGLFVFEITRNRQAALLHVQRIESESQARREAEEQLKILVDSSPAAIFTADAQGRVLLANEAAHRMLSLPEGALSGKAIGQYLPSLANVPALEEGRQSFRTVMQCRGRREDGEAFLADVWFSTYRTSAGPRLAAMVVDASEDLRNREELSLHHLSSAARILVGAVSHEIRNVCGAIAMVHQNLARNAALAGNKDFEALGTLITDLQALLDELRIIVEPALREDGITAHWDVDAALPAVWADRQSLMQVFLNLIKNSERAMRDTPQRELTISAGAGKRRISVRFRDTGSGVAHPDRLFRPFQQGAQATGLGLYLSRALMRSFGGDLRYEPEPQGSTFVVDLAPALASHGEEAYERGDQDPADRRSQPISREPQPVVGRRT
jgi:PAS domain S-box-containing protein